MLFRRKTTEQVYATLQQVQRRMSEVSPPPAAGASPAAGKAQLRFPTPAAATEPARPATGRHTEHGSPAQPPLQAPPASGRFVLHIPVSLASTITLVWLLSLVVAFLIGQRTVRTQPLADPAPVAPVAGEPAKAESAKRQGDWIMVLKSVPGANAEGRTRLQAEADRLNAYVKPFESRGWKPYFGVREPVSGQLEFVFGKVDGQFGVDRAAFEDFFKLMASPPPKGGGYASAKWVKVE